MQLFSKSIKRNQRIQLNFSQGYKHEALTFAIKDNSYTKAEEIFLIDIARDCREELLQGHSSINIAQPQDMSELFYALHEINDYVQSFEVKEVCTIINDWESICYFAQRSDERVSFEDLVLELKLLGDFTDVFVLNKSSNQRNQVLKDWSDKTHLISGHQKLSSFNKIKSEKQEETPKEENTLFKDFIDRLVQAQGKEDLLSIRKEIQSETETFTNHEKTELSNAYRVHLQRIKLLDEKSLNEELEEQAS